VTASLDANRYLSPEAKARVLLQWEAAKAQQSPSGDLGGRGYPDLEIVPLCDALNTLPGICTLQSCSGHPNGDQHRPAGNTGLLWLWLDEPTSYEFDRVGSVLARLPGIETVSRRYSPWGQEITAIEFDGRFSQAIESVMVFFSTLSPTSGSLRHDLWPSTRYPVRQK
jgi:hypothetical protein